MESNIVEQVKQILLQRSVSYPETLPDVGNRPIFPDRQVYIVQILRINNIIWVELLRDELPIDCFEIIVEGEQVNCIEHPVTTDSCITPITNFPRTILQEFSITSIEFLNFRKREERKCKLNKLFKVATNS